MFSYDMWVFRSHSLGGWSRISAYFSKNGRMTDPDWCLGHGDQLERKLNARRFGLKVPLFCLRFEWSFSLLWPCLIVPAIWHRFKLSFIICFLCIAMMVVFTTNVLPFEWQIPGYQWALIIPLSLVVGCHILLPVRVYVFVFPLRHGCILQLEEVFCTRLCSVTTCDCRGDGWMDPGWDYAQFPLVFVFCNTWSLTDINCRLFSILGWWSFRTEHTRLCFLRCAGLLLSCVRHVLDKYGKMTWTELEPYSIYSRARRSDLDARKFPHQLFLSQALKWFRYWTGCRITPTGGEGSEREENPGDFGMFHCTIALDIRSILLAHGFYYPHLWTHVRLLSFLSSLIYVSRRLVYTEQIPWNY